MNVKKYEIFTHQRNESVAKSTKNTLNYLNYTLHVDWTHTNLIQSVCHIEQVICGNELDEVSNLVLSIQIVWLMMPKKVDSKIHHFLLPFQRTLATQDPIIWWYDVFQSTWSKQSNKKTASHLLSINFFFRNCFSLKTLIRFLMSYSITRSKENLASFENQEMVHIFALEFCITEHCNLPPWIMERCIIYKLVLLDAVLLYVSLYYGTHLLYYKQALNWRTLYCASLYHETFYYGTHNAFAEQLVELVCATKGKFFNNFEWF